MHYVRPVLLALLMIGVARTAGAIDLYEIQIYPVETAPPGHVDLELHLNSVTRAAGEEAKQQLSPYQIHATLEATYGMVPWLEIGQYLATGRLDNGNYEYAGSRTKVHFSIPQTADWLISFGGNVELDYMRRAAEENARGLEMRPIAETHFGNLGLIGNFAFEKPFNGPGTHEGVTFAPSGELEYVQLLPWLSPALEYYGDLGPLSDLPGAPHQQHFLVPAVNLEFADHGALNLGVGFGLTQASDATLLKAIVGWTF